MHFKEIFEREITDPPIRDMRRQTAYYPSSASIEIVDEATGGTEVIGSCMRQEYYKMTKEPSTGSNSASGVLKMNAGNILQPLVEAAFKQAGIWRASETSFYNEKMNISGRIDFWLVDSTQVGENGREVMIPCELKTLGKYAEAGTCYPKEGKMLPKIEHLLQCIPYLDYYSQFIPDLKIVMFYLGRDGMELGEHHVKLAGSGAYGCKIKDDQRYLIVHNETGVYEMKNITVRGVYKRYLILHGHVKAGTVPPPDFEDQWSNRKLLAYAQAGSKHGKLNATECKKVLDLHGKDATRVDDDVRPFIDKGDFTCGYCGWHTLCRSGIKHMAKPVFRADGPTELKGPDAPIVDEVESPL